MVPLLSALVVILLGIVVVAHREISAVSDG